MSSTLSIYARIEDYDVVFSSLQADASLSAWIDDDYPPKDDLERMNFEATDSRLYVHTPFTLIPNTEQLDQLDHARILQDVFPSKTFEAVLTAASEVGTIVFELPTELKRTCRVNFGSTAPRHIVELILERYSAPHDGVLMHHQRDGVIITAWKAGALALCQYYEIRDEMDVLYYLTSVYTYTSLNREEIPTTLCGRIDKNGTIFKKLQSYFHLTFWQDEFRPMELHGAPIHRYFPLLLTISSPS